MGPWMHGTAWDGWAWMVGWHLVGTALFVAAVVVIVLILRRELGRSNGTDPRRILAERYARGEIDDEEYQRRREALR